MATKENKDSWFSKSTSPPDVHFHVHGRSYHFNRKLLMSKSGKLALLLKDKKKNEEVTYTFKDIPGDSTTFYMAMRFCYGIEPNLTADNIVPLICLANYLDMTEDICPGNLLNKTLNFFHIKVLPIWNQSIKAFQTMEHLFQESIHLGLLDSCLNSLLSKARLHPRLLGDPLKNPACHDNGKESDDYRPNARKKLFSVNNYQSEDITSLSLQFYDLALSKMTQNGVPSEYIAVSVFKYAKKWAHIDIAGEEALQDCREVIETLEKLLPDEKGLLPCKALFEMLQSAIAFQASCNCRYGFEMRIGKQLNEARVEDLLIPSQGYAMEMKYDTECVKRILKNFYANYSSSGLAGLIKVSELIEEFLLMVATDVNLTKDAFISLSAISIAISLETKRYSDGIYRAIDVYLENHSYLTEAEKEEVCQGLDCYKMSPEACTHAARNKNLPLRVVVQVLFVGQLQIRDVITSKIDDSEKCSQRGGNLVEEKESEVKLEIEKMDSRVMELENECDKMKKQIEVGVVVKEKGKSRWKSLKRKFGCATGVHDNDDCQVKKKVHPRNGV